MAWLVHFKILQGAGRCGLLHDADSSGNDQTHHRMTTPMKQNLCIIIVYHSSVMSFSLEDFGTVVGGWITVIHLGVDNPRGYYVDNFAVCSSPSGVWLECVFAPRAHAGVARRRLARVSRLWVSILLQSSDIARLLTTWELGKRLHDRMSVKSAPKLHTLQYFLLLSTKVHT